MRRLSLILLLLLLAVSPAFCFGATEFVSLDGKWTIRQDAENVGKEGKWFAEPLTGETFEVSVPGVMQEVYPDYHGVAWYEREFETPENPNANGRALLRFWQVEYKADVWLNGVYLGWHEGGEEEFELDATKALAPVGKTNRLTVRAINPGNEPIDGLSMGNIPRRNNTIVITPGSGYESGGIVDSVDLMLVPAVRIADLHLVPNWKTGEIEARMTLENCSDAAVKGAFSLMAASCDGGEFTAPATFEANVAPGVSRVDGKLLVPNFKLWNLNDPNLYSVVASVDVDSATGDRRAGTCGFRDFRFERGYFRLNGKRIYVKCSHSGSDSPITHRVPFDPDLYRKDIITCKTMGFNMIRYIAGMPRRFQLDLCDRIGFLVYDECLAGWCYGECPERTERYIAQTKAMIRRDRNHPSVVIWGFLNETIEARYILLAAAFLEEARELDPDRMAFLNSGSFDQFADVAARKANYAIWRRAHGAIMPAAIKNFTDDSFRFDGTIWTAHTFFLHPGDSLNEYAALKWTAPKDGSYKLDAHFWDVVCDGVATVDIHLFKVAQGAEPQELWTGFLNLNGRGKDQFVSTNPTEGVDGVAPEALALKKGDSLMVVVGIGDDRGTGDTTATDLKITSDSGEVYDVNADYSFENNPNGVWTYGSLPAGPAPNLAAFEALEVGQETLAIAPIGRFANPGSLEWQNELSDTHPYKRLPHTVDVINELRTHSKNNLPVFLSEYGIGSGVDLFRLTRYYEQLGATNAADAKHYRMRYDGFVNDWNRWKLEDCFANQEDYFRQALANMADQRRIGINAIRANANVVAHSVTGTHDQGISGEGLTTIFRELKPGTVDAMADVFAPLRFCNFVEPVQVRAGDEVKLEAVLVNEDVMKPGDYPVRYVAVGPNNERLFDKVETLTIPDPGEGGENPIVMPAFSATFKVPEEISTGECKFYAEFLEGGASAGGVERFYSFDVRTFPNLDENNPYGPGKVYVWGDDADLLAKLAALHIAAEPFSTPDGGAVAPKPGDVLLVGKSTNRTSDEEFSKLYELISSGVNAIFLSLEPFGFQGDAGTIMQLEGGTTRPLPFTSKGVFNKLSNWLYHKDDWAKRDPAFDGLQAGCVVDYVFYRELIPRYTFRDQEPAPDVVIAGAFDSTAFGSPTGYNSGLSMAEWNIGKGRMLISTWLIQEALPTPIADRMLRNLIVRAKTSK